MSLIPHIEIAPEVQQEPDQWHVYRALVMYRYDHQDDTDNHVYLAALSAAHDAYIEQFGGDA